MHNWGLGPVRQIGIEKVGREGGCEEVGCEISLRSEAEKGTCQGWTDRYYQPSINTKATAT